MPSRRVQYSTEAPCFERLEQLYKEPKRRGLRRTETSIVVP
jgi:hypothetical protein